VWKNQNQLKRTALKQKKKKHVHRGKELEAHQVEKGRLSCVSDAPQVGSARSDLTRVMVIKQIVARRDPTVYIFHMCSTLLKTKSKPMCVQ